MRLSREEEAVAATLASDHKSDATRASDSVPAIAPSRRIQLIPGGTHVGRYVVSERLGWGGMGVVYRAADPKLGRDVALKLVMTVGDIAVAQARLEAEAKAMAKLHHPNVVSIHDIGSYKEQLFIAMELCTAGSLARWIREPKPWREIVKRFVAAGRGLAAAHRIGLVHRDFKPDNVLIAEDGSVKVSDFGLVRQAGRELGEGTQELPDAIEGTPAYMAPEQLVNGAVDARADQWAFAVSLWEALCGCKPYQPDDGPDLLEGMLRSIRSRRRMRADAVVVPKRLLRVIERALEPEPADRWPALDDMLAELERALAPRRGWLYGAGAGVAVAVGLVAYMVLRPPAVDPALTKTIGLQLGALYQIAAVQTHDADAAAQTYHFALAATGDPKYRLAAGLALLHGGRCGAQAELSAYVQETHATLDDDTRRQAASLFAVCATDPAQATDDPDMLEQLADKLMRTEPEKAIATLKRALVLTKDTRPYLWKRIADFEAFEGDCDEARVSYEVYIGIARLAGAELAAVREAAKSCKPPEQ